MVRRSSLQLAPAPIVVEGPSSVAMAKDGSAASTAGNKHSRRPSKHSRQVSVSTRRESMDIMSGLIASGSIQSSNPAYLAAHGSPDFLKGPGGSSPTFPYPASPRSPHVAHPEEVKENERESALSALEGRTLRGDEVDKELGLPLVEDSTLSTAAPQPTSLANKRASWGNAASAMALQGGKGAECLGMLVEEEEDEEDDDQVKSLPSPTVSPTRRTRPTSLFIPPAARSSAFVAPSAPSPDMIAPIGFAQRPLSLSLSLKSGPASSEASKALKQQRRQSAGLRSLTLGASSSSVESNSNLSMSSTTSPVRRPSATSATSPSTLVRSVSSTSVASNNRRASTSFLNNGQRKPSLSTSISYKGLNGLTQPQQGYSFADSDSSAGGGFGSLVMEEDLTETVAVNDEKERLLQAQLDTLQADTTRLQEELSAARAELAVRQAESDRDFTDLQSRTVEETRALHMRVFELENSVQAKVAEVDAIKTDLTAVTAELEEMKEVLNDAVAERDDIQGDVDGWRQRCSDLEKAVQAERTKFEDERRDGLLTREKLRKLGDRLAANNTAGAGSSANNNEDAALASAQAKLIGEMRDQIFSLAGALEREQRDHRATKALLQESENSRIQQHHPGTDRSHNASESSGSSVGRSFNSSFNSFSNMTEMTDDTSFSASESSNSIYGASSFGTMSCTDLNSPITPGLVGGLHTLAEEDEEEEEEEEAQEAVEVVVEGDSGAWTDAEEEDAVPELDFQDTETDPSVARAKQSTQSSVDETMPKTPIRDSPDPATMHRRSDSFIKQWTFPKGPVVEPLHIVIPDDHCFFSLSSAEKLPALPLTPLAMEMPPFFASDLVVDEDEARRSFDSFHSRRPSSPRSSVSPIRNSFQLSGPPPARSARVSAALSSSTSSGTSISPQTKMSRMSLQGISSLISSTFAAVPASAGAVGMASAAANLCHAREDSVFAEDHRALLETEVSIPKVGSMKRQIVASPLNRLDFTYACGVPRAKVIRI